MHPIVILFQKWHYLVLLFALLILLVLHPIASDFGIMKSLFDAFFVFVMLILILGLARESVWRFVACILCIPAAALSIGGHFLSSPAEAVSVAAGHAIAALFFVAVACKIVHSILTSQQLSLDSVFGAICGYLLLGVAFALTYANFYAADPASFQLAGSVRQELEHGNESRNLFIYYSFVTLTTVGYGDVTPVSTAARTLSWMEAMTGQMYLAVLIAGLISALVANKSARTHRNADQRPA